MNGRQEGLDQHFIQLRLICSAILGGVVIFGGVVWYLLDSGAYAPGEVLPSYLALLLNVVALLVLILALFLPRFFPHPGRGAEPDRILNWHKRNVILGFALREGAAFLALIGVLVTGEEPGGYAVAALAVVAMVMSWPRKSQLEGEA